MTAYLKDTASKKSHERDLGLALRLAEHFAGRDVNALTPTDIAEYKSMRRSATVHRIVDGRAIQKGIADSTIAKELWLLSGAIRHAREQWGWKIENPVSGRVPPARKSAPKWLTVEEVDRLKAAVRRSPHLVDFIELALNTGMRCEELLALEWRRVNFGTRTVWFDDTDQKSGIPGSIPLNQGALAVLRRRQDYRRQKCPDNPWVFCTTGQQRLQWIKRTFARAAARAKVKASPHSLRHTFASRLVQAGVPLRTVCDLCRHGDIRTTMIYAHLAPHNAESAIAVLDNIGRDQNVTEKGHGMANAG